MDRVLKERFLSAALRFRKTDFGLLPRGGIQYKEMVVMGSLGASAPHAPCHLNTGEICERLCITKPAISQSLNALEKKGYITRTVDTQDRRKITVAVTPEGVAVMEQSWRCYDDALGQLLSRFGHEKAQVLLELLEEFTVLCEQAQGPQAESDERIDD